MALKAWYTFNNNYNNQGCGNAELTVVTAPTYVNGKMGKALNQGAFKWTAEQTAQILNNKALTICFWVYIDLDTGSTSNRAMFFGNDPMSSAGGRQFSLFNYSTSNDLHWSWQNYINGAYSMVTSGIVKDVIPSRTWTHIAVTYENPNGTIYINGVQQQTFSGIYNTDSFAFETQVIHDSQYHRFNDYRIYDECLSSKQIKEISKGLCAHYKLEGVGANPNLLYPSSLMTNLSNYSTKNWSIGTINNVTSSSWTSEGYSVTTPGNQTGNPNNGRMISVENANTLIPAGTKVTFSIDIKGAATTARIRGFYQGTGTAFYSNFVPINEDTTATDTEWHRYYGTFTMPNVGTADTRLFIALSQGYDEVTTRVYRNARLSLEDGTIYWIPNEAENEYATLGYDKALITDVSGFNYNSIVSGILNYNSDSPRYSGSTVFDNINTNYMHRDTFDWLQSPYTFNCWIYQTNATTSSSGKDSTLQFIESQGRDCGYAGFSLCSANGYARLYLGTATTGTYYTINDSTVNLLNKWHMLTGTFDGTTAKLYVDGVLKGSKVSAIEPVWTEAHGFTIGKMSYGYTNTAAYFPFVGSISDVRVYCTALSVEDILKLYEISGIIDNKGNAYAYEFKEE